MSNFATYYMPRPVLRFFFRIRTASLSHSQKEMARKRAEYYCRLEHPLRGDLSESVAVRDYKYPFKAKKKFATYFFDLYRSVSLFGSDHRFRYRFGDIEEAVDPTEIVKARWIAPSGQLPAGVIMKLNRVRHFAFVKDPYAFAQKDDVIFFRNVAQKQQPARMLLLHKYFGHPMCDFGRINNDDDGFQMYRRDFVPIDSQLKHKFIICAEGNDVATNLKWVMSSNSIAVMPEPTMESWFMEGKLIPDYHYICVKPDFSDLIEKTSYYAAHPEEAERIVRQAHEWVSQFRNGALEDYTAWLVLDRYFSNVTFSNDGI